MFFKKQQHKNNLKPFLKLLITKTALKVINKTPELWIPFLDCKMNMESSSKLPLPGSWDLKLDPDCKKFRKKHFEVL